MGDFKEDLLKTYVNSSDTDDFSDRIVQEDERSDIENIGGDYVNVRELSKLIEKSLSHLMLKLDCIFNVPNRCIDKVVEELHFISHSALTPIIKDILQSCLRRHNCEIDEAIVSEMVKDLCDANPISSALGGDGRLSTAYKRREYFKEHFSVVKPIEYVLSREKNSFQYVPILESLLQVLSRKDLQELILREEETRPNLYESFHDGTYYKNNKLFSGSDLTIALNLYVDDFEICNPLGSSRKKHKITAVYWVLASIYPELNVFSNFVQSHGFKKIWLQYCVGATAQRSCSLRRRRTVCSSIG